MKEGVKQLRKDLKDQLRAVKLIEAAIAMLSGGRMRKQRKAKKVKAEVAEVVEEAPRRKRKAVAAEVEKAA